MQYLQLRLVSVGHEGGPCQVVLGYRRVDEEIQQQMEQQALLAEALDKANSAITSKNAFLSNMSHDMRTPFSASRPWPGAAWKTPPRLRPTWSGRRNPAGSCWT